MADNIELASASGGATIRTDDDGTAQWQYVKLAFGADNTQNIVTSASTNPLPVILGPNSGVDVGDVDVTSVIPGTGATNLGKAIDSPLGSTDTGVLVLAIHSGEAAKIGVAEEDYDHLHVGELGGLSVEPEQHNHLNEFDSTSGWTVLGNDTLNFATTLNHLTGSNALTFDKVNGAADTVFAGIQNTISAVNMGELDLHDIIQSVCFVSSLANVDYVFIRIGTDSTNYNEWRAQDDDLTAGEFQILGFSIGSASNAGNTGNGVDWSAITYIAVGVAFDNQANTLSGIIFDQLGLFTNNHTTATIAAEVTSNISSANVNVRKWGNTNVTVNAGNADSGTLRVVLATDQASLTVDNAGTFAVQSTLQAGTAAFGKLSANSGVDIGDVDVTSISAGANLIGDVGISGARTSGGTTPLKNLDVDEDAGDVIKNSAGQLYWIHAMNTGAVPNYLKFYNVAGASVTVGTDVPALTFLVPANADSDGAGFVLSVPNGIAFGTAISMAATLNAADNDATAPTGTVVVNLGFA